MTGGGSLVFILPLSFRVLKGSLGGMAAPKRSHWTPLEWTLPGQGFHPGRKAEVIPVIIMRCDGMQLRNRKLKLNVFCQGWSSTELAPEGRGKSWAL